jgi:FKBP-type peptidyl-prolyl cis-trans isomerase FkpA
MGKKIGVFFLAVFVWLHSSSQTMADGFIAYDSVTSYKIIRGIMAKPVKVGAFINNHIQQWYPNIGDSCVYNTDDFGNSMQFIDSVSLPSIYGHVIEKSYLGDSIILRMLATEAFNPFPELVKNGDYLYTTIKIEAVYYDAKEAEAAATAIAKAFAIRKDIYYKRQSKIEDAILKQYFVTNKMALAKLKKSKTGVYVNITKPGVGPLITATDKLKIYYRGKTLNGTVFDSNMDGSFGHSEVYELDLAVKNSVIQGWQKGLLFFNKGAKGTMYIPSPLAYGKTGNGAIGPNEILVFDIVIDNITAVGNPKKRLPSSKRTLNKK